ncbi:MAG: hypothetical protein ACRCYY_08905 [Trueperaceae bacterium]
MIHTSNHRQAAPVRPFQHLLKRLQGVHPTFFVSGILTAVMGLFFISGIFLDSRYITGSPAWLKLSKFAVSVVIYTFTMLWFLSFVDTSKRWRKRLVNILGWILVTTFAAEWFGMITQVIRGTTSHFNVSSPLNAALWSLMAVAIMILFITNIVIAVLLLRQRFESPVFAWGLRLGLLITIVGLGEGYLMTDPTAQQLAGWKNGEPITIVGAHSVGVEDGGPGLPGLNWSTVGGDLRIGHFVGMHALQVLPFVAWFISRRKKLSTRQQVQLVWTAGLGYLGITALVTWQALRAEPIIAPSQLTITAFLMLVAFIALATTAILLGRKRTENKENLTW